MEDISRQNKVLLESGTNEVEIMVFILGEQKFGINVAKVKKLEQYEQSLLAPIPGNPVDAAIRGYYYFRKTPLPMIDLARAVKIKSTKTQNQKLVLITEFNNLVNAFLIDDLVRIHRGSWKDISPPPPSVASITSTVTGSIRIDDHDVLLLDLEDIIGRLFPHTSLAEQKITRIAAPAAGGAKIKGREQTKIMVAEDSVTIRTLITKLLTEAGYSGLHVFNDGQDAFDEVVKLKQEAEAKGGKLKDALDIIITDIEMPRMDGLTLCRKTRETLAERDIPVIMFSSLIDDQMIAKCRSVGASNYITKPQIEQLVKMLDGFREKL